MGHIEFGSVRFLYVVIGPQLIPVNKQKLGQDILPRLQLNIFFNVARMLSAVQARENHFCLNKKQIEPSCHAEWCSGLRDVFLILEPKI